VSEQLNKDEATLCEQEAMAAYRQKYPDGVAWQDLHQGTRDMWIVHVQDNAQRSAE
jgi:hypothetical protein